MSQHPKSLIRELKQPRRRRQPQPHNFANLTMKNIIFARFARALFNFWHFVDVVVLSTTWNDLFYWCVDNVSLWWQMFNFVFSCPMRWFQFDSRIVRTHFSSIMSLGYRSIEAFKCYYGSLLTPSFHRSTASSGRWWWCRRSAKARSQ